MKLQKLIIVVFSITTFLGLFLLFKGSTLAAEDGWGYPPAVNYNLDTFCSSGQRSAQTTWISLASDPGATTTTATRGSTVNLMLNVVTKRCSPGLETRLVADRFSAKGGSYTLPGDGNSYQIPQLQGPPDLIVYPPAANGPAYSRASWPFSINISNNAVSGTVNIVNNSKQYSWRLDPAYLLCIMPSPQTPMFGNGTAPPGTQSQDIINEMNRVCPTVSVNYVFNIFVPPPIPSCNPATDPTCPGGGDPTCNPATDPTCPGGGTCDPLADPTCPLPPGSFCNPLTDPTCPGYIPPPKYNLEAKYEISSDGKTVDFSVENSEGGTSEKADGSGVTVTMWVIVEGFNVFSTTLPSEKIAGNGTNNYPYNITGSLNAGDEVCAFIRVEPASGITGGAADSGSFSEKDGSSANCFIFSSKPYFRAYGNDVIVGRNFANPSGCIVNSGVKQSIRAFNSNSGSGWSGAGVQFAASATGIIDGFMSASMHSGSPGTDDIPKPNAGLTFSNTDSDNLGNDEGAYKGCMGDYKSLANDIVAKGIDSWKDASNITDIDTELSNHILLYRGDLTINTNIPSSPTGNPSYSSISDIKTNLIIVTGNIYIDYNVTDVDGLFVALEDGGLGGVINTCGNTDTPVGNCKSDSLTIHGAFLADEVKLNRIIGDYAKATPNETSADPLENIAEKFIFTPDFYLGLINTTKTSGEIQSSTTYDSMVSLPAVL